MGLIKLVSNALEAQKIEHIVIYYIVQSLGLFILKFQTSGWCFERFMNILAVVCILTISVSLIVETNQNQGVLQ